MTEYDVNTLLMFAGWAAFSLANLSARSKRTAAALERLADLAERGRR